MTQPNSPNQHVFVRINKYRVYTEDDLKQLLSEIPEAFPNTVNRAAAHRAIVKNRPAYWVLTTKCDYLWQQSAVVLNDVSFDSGLAHLLVHRVMVHNTPMAEVQTEILRFLAILLPANDLAMEEIADFLAIVDNRTDLPNGNEKPFYTQQEPPKKV